jgi:kynurenine formamidase
MLRRTQFALLLCLVFGGCTQTKTDSLSKADFPAGKILDLSHPFDDQTIYWPTEDGFKFEKGFDGVTPQGFYYAANKFCAPEHGGTHIDAPKHFAVNSYTVDQIPLEQLMGNAILVDVTKQSEANRDYQVTIEDFNAWERQHGQMPGGSIILLRTGFAKHWPDRVKYMGTDERGAGAVPKLHFPGLSPDAARWLTTNRSIKAIGLDTPSIDYGQSTLFESHQILFAKNIPAFENLGDMSALPARDFVVIALPIKISGGSGGPLRVAAIVK